MLTVKQDIFYLKWLREWLLLPTDFSGFDFLALKEQATGTADPSSSGIVDPSRVQGALRGQIVGLPMAASIPAFDQTTGFPYQEDVLPGSAKAGFSNQDVAACSNDFTLIIPIFLHGKLPNLSLHADKEDGSRPLLACLGAYLWLTKPAASDQAGTFFSSKAQLPTATMIGAFQALGRLLADRPESVFRSNYQAGDPFSSVP